MPAQNKPDWRRMAEAARQRRAVLGLTQHGLLAQIEPPISIETIRRVEAGDQRSYRLTTLATISRALGWPPDALWRVAQGADPVELDRETELDRRLSTLENEVGQLRELAEEVHAAVLGPTAPPQPVAAKRAARQ